MSIILNIDTAIDITCVSIARDGKILCRSSNTQQNEHGGFLQPAIQELFITAAIPMQQIDAVAIAAGPGSYTGLRVGMAAAKGLCFGLKKPLITVGTLEILALAVILQAENLLGPSLFCPMIDARRSEVFTAIYDHNLRPVLSPTALILDEGSFAKSLLKSRICFFGNGSQKWKLLCTHPNAVFIAQSDNQLALCNLAAKKYELKEFAGLAYSSPFYLKEFFTGHT